MSGKLFHAPFINAHPGFELIGAWERSQQKIKQDYPSCHSYTSLESLLQDDAIELVVVNTPNYTHFEMAKACLLAGKNVLVEKAFTPTIAEALELFEVAKKMNKVVTVYQNRRFDSDFKTFQVVLESGALGDIVDVSIRFDRYKPEVSPKIHKETPLPGAGILYDLGPHIVDQALVLFGLPDKIFANIRTTRPNALVPDWFELMLYYPQITVKLGGGFLTKEALPSFVANGVNGSFMKERTDIQEFQLLQGLSPLDPSYGIEISQPKGLIHYTNEVKDIRKNISTLPGNYLEFYEQLYQAIRNNSAPPVTQEIALAVIQILNAAEISHAQQKVIQLT
jgi:predicted dehydrogenase